MACVIPMCGSMGITPGTSPWTIRAPVPSRKVRDPFVREYGESPRNFNLNGTCACTTSKGEGPLLHDSARAGIRREPQELH